MHVCLIGSDVEENLGLGMVGASLMRAGHLVSIVPFNEIDEIDGVVRRIEKQHPNLVGLGMQFQHRSADFVLLARSLRRSGFTGHITAGGQYATLAGDELLTHNEELDSVVLHEAERSAVELAAALQTRAALKGVSGLLIRDSGTVQRTGPRPLCEDLDQLPFSLRYRPPNLHLGVPFFPVWGSRGCWGACAFCAITTYYRDAKKHGGGRKLRLRSPANIADEIAILYRAAGGPCIVCFHDDTFVLPRPEDTVERVGAIRRELDARGVGRIGMVGKCRPECVTLDVCHKLKELGVFRLYVGIENASQPGQDHLNRRTRTPQLRQALHAMRSSGIFGCYNLLVFEPDVTLEHVRENIAFIREHASQPMNFCRAEPYHKTPLYERVKARGTLGGSYLGWDYRIEDDRAELLYRICAVVFDGRNFMPAGVANRCMGLGYVAHVLRTFYNVTSLEAGRLLARADELMGQITLDTADFLEEAVALAAEADLAERDLIERKTARLGLRVLAHDKLWHQRLDELLDDMNAFVAQQRRPARSVRIWREALQGAALAGAVAITAPACGGDTTGERKTAASGGEAGADTTGGMGGMMGDNLPPSGGMGGWICDPLGGSMPMGGWIADMLPPTGGTGGWVNDVLPPTGGTAPSGGSGGAGGLVVDSVPGGMSGQPVVAGAAGGLVVDSVPGGMGGWVDDPLPRGGGSASGGEGGTSSPGGNGGDSANGGAGGAAGLGGFVADMLPPSSGSEGIADPLPAPQTSLEPETREAPDHWHNTAPRRAVRTTDLPLFDPPQIRLCARRTAAGIAVTLLGGSSAMTWRWEADGQLEGEGRDVVWHPDDSAAQLRVATRTAGGIAVASLRAAAPESWGRAS